jgi:hypothetical protein
MEKQRNHNRNMCKTVFEQLKKRTTDNKLFFTIQNNSKLFLKKQTLWLWRRITKMCCSLSSIKKAVLTTALN